MSSPPSASLSRQMTFYEMSLLQSEIRLDEIQERIAVLRNEKSSVDKELSQKLTEERELEAKARRF